MERRGDHECREGDLLPHAEFQPARDFGQRHELWRRGRLQMHFRSLPRKHAAPPRHVTPRRTTPPHRTMPRQTTPRTLAPRSVNAGSDVGYVYIGCYEDSRDNRDLSNRQSGTLSTDACAVACSSAGYSYMGRQYTDECFCGNSYGSHGYAADGKCGDEGSLCGNGAGDCGDTNAVYGLSGASLCDQPRHPPDHSSVPHCMVLSLAVDVPALCTYRTADQCFP